MSVQFDLTERLGWPFFAPEHRTVAELVTNWSREHLLGAAHGESRDEVDAQARKLVTALGTAGITRYCVRAEHGGALPEFDSRAICLIRETLAYHDGLADFAFAMQGLGSGSLSIAGDAKLQQQYLPQVASGAAIAAFALSEPEAGSDVAAMQTSAHLDGDHYVLNGTKTWISNAGIADLYCVFARTTPGHKRADGTVEAQGITAFLVEPSDPGFSVEQRIDVIAPHPLGTLRFANCRVPVSRRIGAEGDGFKIAMRTLDIFRASVAAAALGFARRAFDEAVAYSRHRAMFGKTLVEFQLTQAAIAEMATAIDAAALLTYRAAWQRDTGVPATGVPATGVPATTGQSVTKSAAMAKMTATESAQTVIDRAVQMFGGRGVVHGAVVERLYRDIRALRIYEGATEVQKLIIAREVLR